MTWSASHRSSPTSAKLAKCAAWSGSCHLTPPSFWAAMSLPFDLMEGFENCMKVQTFFVLDENLLLHRARAMQLLEHMKAAGKSRVAVFASANAIRKYSMQELVELGVSWIWMGLESVNSKHAKLEGKDTHELTHELREHGIRVQGSTIIGLEHPTPTNIAAEIEHAISHETDFHQFMLYTPVPGTPLYREMKEQGRVLDSVDLADIHGQVKFNFKHAAISRDDSQRFLDFAFWHDFERNAQVSSACAERCSRAGSAIGTIPIRACGNALSEKSPSCAVATSPRYGPWSIGSARSTRRWASRFNLFAKRWKRNSACPRGSVHISWARSCCGWRAAKNAAWPRAKPTNHRRSSNAQIGPPPRFLHFMVLDKPALNASSEVACLEASHVLATLLRIRRYTNSNNTAPTTDMIKPADCPAWYQPIA
jgi:hypothetical protein